MLKALKLLGYTILRIITFPIVLIIPKTNKYIVIVGYQGSYLGNTRHLHEHLLSTGKIKSYFVTNKKNVVMENSNKNIIYLFNLKSMFYIMRAKVIVVDSTHNRLVGILSFKAKMVQLWHGNGMKEIGLLMFHTNKLLFSLRKLSTFFIGSLKKYDLVYFTSEYAELNRSRAFLYKDVKYNGQPRNDLIFHERTNFNKTVLYVPTWRENMDSSLAIVDFDKIDKFCHENNITFIIKLHPMEKFKLNNTLDNIVMIDKTKDIYDELKNVDVMITDYSSIYFDFLLLDRPIIYFAFDREKYISTRKIVYNYDDITPGPKVYSTNDLINELENTTILNIDKYKEKRKKVRDLFYKYQDNKSCERAEKDILEMLNKK